MLLFSCLTEQAFPFLNDTSRVSTPQINPGTSILQADTSVQVSERELKAGLLYDAVNQKIVWQKNSDIAYPIASLTKMMVALLAVEDVRAKKISWDDNVKWVRQTIVGRKKNRHSVYTNVSYSLRDIFKAAMIASNNECAEQMAKYIGDGSLQTTIVRMNDRAKELGMHNSYYGNPTGLPAARHKTDNFSSPVDQLILSMELLKYDEVTEIAGMGYAAIVNGRSTSVIRNHNRLTLDYNGEVDGLKTGYTRRAGFCLVATTSKCGHRLIGIVLGCHSPEMRNGIVRDMFNNYYTSIGLDRLGPNNNSPDGLTSPSIAASQTNQDGQFVTVSERQRVYHKIRKGESLSTIAAKYHCSVTQLKSWNKNSVRSGKIIAGQNIAVYSTVNKTVFIRKPANGSEEDDDKPILSETEKAEIRQEDSAIKVGNTLSVATDSANKDCEVTYVYHTVVPGDTLFSISRQYDGISVEQLKDLNKLSDSNALKPGMKIKVPVKG